MSAKRIPTAPLILGLSGLLPFLWGAATHLWPHMDASAGLLQAFTGQTLLLTYGLTILAFMSGVLWGFATRSAAPVAAWGYGLSVLPALWGVFAISLPPQLGLLALSLAFCALIALDLRAIRLAEAPTWWLRLRVTLTTVAVACLLVGAFG